RQRVWLDVLLYSGLRRGDAVRYGRQHVQNGVGRVKTEKSGVTVTGGVAVPPNFARSLPAGPRRDLKFFRRERRQPVSQGKLRQCLPRSLSCRRRTGLGAWRAEDRSDDCREQWRDHFATQGTVWMDERRDADALHQGRRPRTPRPRGWPHAGERKSNFYS